MITLGCILKILWQCHWNSTFLCSENCHIFTQELILSVPGSFGMDFLSWIHKIRPHFLRTTYKSNKVTQIQRNAFEWTQITFLSRNFAYKEWKLFSTFKNFLSNGARVNLWKGEKIYLGVLQLKGFITLSVECWAAWTLKWNIYCCKNWSQVFQLFTGKFLAGKVCEMLPSWFGTLPQAVEGFRQTLLKHK